MGVVTDMASSEAGEDGGSSSHHSKRGGNARAPLLSKQNAFISTEKERKQKLFLLCNLQN